MSKKGSYYHTVRYSETDKMGFVHHSNYARYYENARWELFRNLGISYKKIEADGILMPVINMKVRFIKPLKYDDKIEVITTITKPPTSKLQFDIQIKNEEKEVINQAEIVLGFISTASKKACRPSNEIIEILNKYF